MPLKQYGVLKGRVVDTQPGSPHYQIHVRANNVDFRIAINVQSQEPPSEVEYLSLANYQPQHGPQLQALVPGFTRLPSAPDGLAIDYTREQLFDPKKMVPLPAQRPGPKNDLNDFVNDQANAARNDPRALVYAFGQRWGPEPDRPDQNFGFLPGNGIHDIHMNQGNHQRFAEDNGIYQDGALFFQFPDAQRWVAIFLSFQSQTWCTNKRGNAIQPCNKGPRAHP